MQGPMKICLVLASPTTHKDDCAVSCHFLLVQGGGQSMHGAPRLHAIKPQQPAGPNARQAKDLIQRPAFRPSGPALHRPGCFVPQARCYLLALRPFHAYCTFPTSGIPRQLQLPLPWVLPLSPNLHVKVLAMHVCHVPADHACQYNGGLMRGGPPGAQNAGSGRQRARRGMGPGAGRPHCCAPPEPGKGCCSAGCR